MPTQNNGKLASQTDNVSGEQVVYAYDALNRLASATATSGSWGQSYSYDGFGNLTAQNVTAGSAPAYSAIPDPTTNHVGSVDANGNTLGLVDPDQETQITSAEYDVENRFVGTGASFFFFSGYQYSYAPGNKRVWRGNFSTNGGAPILTTDEVTFWSVNGQKLASYNILMSGNSMIFNQNVANYYFGSKLIGHYTSNVGLSITATDRLGSIGKYYPYGQEKPSATTNGTEKFTGYFRDSETGFDYADQRFHNPGTGRFLTPDSYKAKTGGAADPKNPTSWNRYGYTLDDPINRVDPTGRCADPISCSIDGEYGTFFDNPELTDFDPVDLDFSDVNGTNGYTSSDITGYEYTCSDGASTCDPSQMVLTAVINNDTTSSSSNSSTNPLSTLWSDVQDLFGYNPNNPLPSCFGLFVSSTLSNLSPASPSLSTLGELAGPAYFAMKWNAALKYALTTPSTTFQTPFLVYPFKSSTFRKTLSQGASDAFRVGLLSQAILAEIQALATEWHASSSGQCQ